MSMRNPGMVWIVLVSLLASSGCAHVISRESRLKARPGLSFAAVQRDPGSYSGETVIWGGRIIDTVNRRDDTFLKILQTPLDSTGMPGEEEHSQGRFIAKIEGYVDREVYCRGRMITVAGEVTGREVEQLGEMEYVYPVVATREVHLWRRPAHRYGTSQFPAWYDFPYPYSVWPRYRDPFLY
ncbi:MAG: Slp family lipoprotein [Syntrophobacteraceae bacterium]|nr:Slp family lipoprotein [Syntrophobacteraceae bacterium]